MHARCPLQCHTLTPGSSRRRREIDSRRGGSRKALATDLVSCWLLPVVDATASHCHWQQPLADPGGGPAASAVTSRLAIGHRRRAPAGGAAAVVKSRGRSYILGRTYLHNE